MLKIIIKQPVIDYCAFGDNCGGVQKTFRKAAPRVYSIKQREGMPRFARSDGKAHKSLINNHVVSSNLSMHLQ
jgi:hypothetical protein